MVRATVAFVLMVFSCAYAAPAPRVVEVTLLRDSFVGYDLGAGNKQAKGAFEGTRHLHLDLPDAAADKAPEITLLDNVNSGTGIALGANVDVDKVLSVASSLKDQLLSGKNPFWRKK